MNKKLALLLLLFFSAKYAISQEYISNLIDPFESSVNYYNLEYFIDKSTDLMGYKKDGKIVIPAQYAFTQGFCKKGIARVTNKSPFNNSMLSPHAHGGYYMMNIIFDNMGLNGFIDTLGNIVVPIKYSALGVLELYEVVPYSIYEEENGKRVQKYGLINDKGEIVVDAIYDFIHQYSKVYEARILKEDGKYEYFYLDHTGKEFGKGGKFNKFVVISTIPPLMFYAEYNKVAYLLDENLSPYATVVLQNISYPKAVEKLLNEYNDRYGEMEQDLQKFHDKVLSKTTEE